MNDIDLREWLTSHSTNVEEVRGEIRFTHFTGDTSILLPRIDWHDDLLSPQSAALRTFYNHYLGASIGNSQIVIGTCVEGGVDISHGLKLPDLSEMTLRALELGMPAKREQEVFMVEAGWMFIYGCDFSANEESLFYYDRDFRDAHQVESLKKVLEDWWELVLNDSIR